jgi:catechol 2,3-dioxygenase-like lactoylglutathione lyase family enzyme
MRTRAVARPKGMSTTTATPRLRRLHLTMVPATDVERAIAFYEALGFEKRADAPFGDGERWVELHPADGTAGIALAPATAQTVGVQTGIILAADDVGAAHAELLAAGLDVDPKVARPGTEDTIMIGTATITGPTPAMFYVRDPDGNALLVVGE